MTTERTSGAAVGVAVATSARTRLTPELLELPSFTDGRGLLVSLEDRQLPFAMRRVYYIIPEETHARGFHAHRELEQYMICVAGSCRVVLDNGKERVEVLLDRPTVAVRVSHMTWREMHDWAPHTVLLVIASMPYDEADYIRNYDEFRAEASRLAGDDQ